MLTSPTLATPQKGPFIFREMSSSWVRGKWRSQPASHQKKLLIRKQRHLVRDADNASKQMFFPTDLI